MFSKPVIKTAKDKMTREGQALLSPIITERKGAVNINNKNRMSETTSTRVNDVVITFLAPILSFFEIRSDTSFMEATGRPEATMAQHTE